MDEEFATEEDADEAFMAKKKAMRAEADALIADPDVDTPGAPDSAS